MRKPEAPEDEARIGPKRKSRANEQRSLQERRRVIEESIARLRELLKLFRNKLH